MMDAEKWKKEADRQHDMLVWLAKRYAKDVTCYRCPAKLSVCSVDGQPHKMRKVCSALIIEAAELATQKEEER